MKKKKKKVGVEKSQLHKIPPLYLFQTNIQTPLLATKVRPSVNTFLCFFFASSSLFSFL
jgi:hypothetical protein